MGNGREATNRIGLALGSGSSRGWAHIGVIRALSEVGIEPDIVCGCSVGALVGASYSAGMLDRLEQWVTSLTKLEFARFFELNLSLTGFIDTERLRTFLAGYVCGEGDCIENLAKTYAAVSTELETGREIWFTRGPVLEAVRASISIPGLFPPLFHEGKWLVDGGLVNPVPVSLCRSLGADIVIAVNLNGDTVSKHPKQKEEPADGESIVDRVAKTFKSYSTAVPRHETGAHPARPDRRDRPFAEHHAGQGHAQPYGRRSPGHPPHAEIIAHRPPGSLSGKGSHPGGTGLRETHAARNPIRPGDNPAGYGDQIVITLVNTESSMLLGQERQRG
jgi:NTE family protein